MDDWRLIESVTEYETGWYTGGYDRLEQPDGTEKDYYWADLPQAVVIVAVHEGDVLFVEQYRPTVRETFLELPAGIVEDGESFADAGARELEEETGFAPETVEPLQEYWVATGVLRHRRGVVVAGDLTPGEPDPDGNEFLSVERHPVDEAIDLARSAPANDSTLSALLLAEREGYL